MCWNVCIPKDSHRKLKIAENETPNNIHHSYILLVTIHAQTRLRGKVCLLLWAGPVGLGGGSWHLVGPVCMCWHAWKRLSTQ